MAFPVWLNNLIAYSLQIAILAAAGTLLAYLFRLRVPRVMLIYWQLLLLVCLFVPCMQTWKHPVLTPVASSVEPAFSTISPVVSKVVAPTGLNRAKPFSWETGLLILAAGVVLRLLWLMIGFIRLQRFRRKSHLFTEERSVIQDMQWRTGVRVTVLLSSAVHSPVTFGLRSPMIILPLSFKDLSESCKQAVLCHELLHVRRCDWILIIMEEFVRSLFWFHPAIWWLLSRIHLSREQAVDYEVVQLIGNKQPYLDSLLEFARTHRRLNAVPAPLFLREHHLVERVALLIKEVSMSRLRLTVSMIGIFALLVFAFYLAAGWFPLTGTPVLAQVQNSDAESKTFATAQTTVEITASPAQEEIPMRRATKPPQNAPMLRAEARPRAPEPNSESESNSPQKQPVRIGGNIAEARLVHRVPPVYPELAKRARVQGKVTLTATTDEVGNVVDVQVVSGHPLLNDAAVTAVKEWKYSPTELNGEKVPIIATVTVIFNLGGGQDMTVWMDSSGNLTYLGNPIQPEQILKMANSLKVGVDPDTPYRVAESVINDFIKKGLKDIDVGGPYVLYQGQLFYLNMSRSNWRNDGRYAQALAVTPEADNEKKYPLQIYQLFINEAGEAVGLKRILGSEEFPDFEKALMYYRGDPVILNGEPVPSAQIIDLFGRVVR